MLATGAVLLAARLFPQPGVGFYWRVASLLPMPRDNGPVDFATLERRKSPNDALACLSSLCARAKIDFPSPSFPVPVEELRKRVDIVVGSEPNSDELTCTTDCATSGRFVEYSPLFRFPDVIDVKVIEAGAGKSTLAIYSRSVVGYWDFGVNAERVRRWLAALTRITEAN
jgi:uncharacterized protein (DUF1499 family)